MIKTDPGKAGGDLQEDDIMYMRGEIEIKKTKLNELHEVGGERCTYGAFLSLKYPMTGPKTLILFKVAVKRREALPC